MVSPDSTAAFEADAARDTDDVQALRDRIAELEQRDKNTPTADGEVVEVIDPNDPTTDVARAPETVTIHGHDFRFHIPKPAALTAFGLGAAGGTKRTQLMLRTMNNFLAFHIIEEDFALFMELMMNPEEEDFTEDTLGDIISAMVDVANASAEAQAPKTGPRR